MTGRSTRSNALGKAGPRLVIRSPRSGYVIEKKIVVGSSVEPGMTLLEVADLAAVWIEADVYEKDIAFLQRGQPIEATVESLPNRTFQGRLALIYPRLETSTRTNRVRFELENSERALRPGMFATVRISTPLESIEPYKTLAAAQRPVVLASLGTPAAPLGFPIIPERAVIDTGLKKIVYIQREPGLFEGVEVELGPRVELQDGPRTVDYYPVLKGLKPGDQVAAAGSFLIDAETRLNPAAASSYFGASGGPQGGSRGDSAGPAGPREDAGTPTDTQQQPPTAGEPSAEDLANIDKLPEPDRQVASQQRMCPITDFFLGSMGVPYKITLRGEPVFLCCEGCAGAAKKSPRETLEKIARFKRGH